jgi:hypothetical protein
MYKYINPENDFLNAIKEALGDDFVDVVKMIPKEHQRNIEFIRQGIKTQNHEKIRLAVLTLKTNLRYILAYPNPILDFCDDFENAASAKSKNKMGAGNTQGDTDYTALLEELIQKCEAPIKEATHFCNTL